MSEAMASSFAMAAYLALFSSVGIVFLFVNLLVGKFLRPSDPHPEKQEIYECGEPTIGSSFVQFDLRFYVVALLFIIFDVEVAFFFPWAAVFGKSTHMMDPHFQVVESSPAGPVLTRDARLLYQEIGVRNPTVPTEVPPSLRAQLGLNPNTPSPITSDSMAAAVVHQGFRQFVWVTLIDIAVFFGILLVGFAYVWKRGDLDWVRAVGEPRATVEMAAQPNRRPRAESVLTV